MYREVINFYILILYPVILQVIIFVIITIFSWVFQITLLLSFVSFFLIFASLISWSHPTLRPGLRSWASLGESGGRRCVWESPWPTLHLERLPSFPGQVGAGTYGKIGWGCHQVVGRGNSTEQRSAEPVVGSIRPASHSLRTHSEPHGQRGLVLCSHQLGILNNVSMREGVHFHFALGPMWGGGETVTKEAGETTEQRQDWGHDLSLTLCNSEQDPSSSGPQFPHVNSKEGN